MAERKKVGLREVRTLQPNEITWDSAVPGFGARRQRGAVTYILKYRTAGARQRWHTIGRHGAPWTPDTARDEARRLLGEVVKGGDPAADKHAARHALTLGELCDRYLADAEAGRLLIRGGRIKKPRTLATDRGMIEGHIKPLLGRQTVVSVTRADVESFMHAIAGGETKRDARKVGLRAVSKVRGGRGVASRTIGLLGAVFSYAVRKDFRPNNPVRGVQRPADGRRERRLTDAEYARLGTALRAAARPHVPPGVTRNRTPTAMWPAAVAAAWFLALTGWRSGEAMALRWSEVDLARRTVILPDSKTGRSMRPLSQAACNVLRDQSRTGDLVFPPTRGERTMSGFRKLWDRIAKLGALPADVTPHVLRHSFASLAGDLGYSELTIGTLIGHKGLSITSRYVHAADSVLLAAADAVADETLARMRDATHAAEILPVRGGG